MVMSWRVLGRKAAKLQLKAIPGRSRGTTATGVADRHEQQERDMEKRLGKGNGEYKSYFSQLLSRYILNWY